MLLKLPILCWLFHEHHQFFPKKKTGTEGVFIFKFSKDWNQRLLTNTCVDFRFQKSANLLKT
jgi:hypothetical protein